MYYELGNREYDLGILKIGRGYKSIYQYISEISVFKNIYITIHTRKLACQAHKYTYKRTIVRHDV